MSKPPDPGTAEISQWVRELREGTDVEQNARRIFEHFYPHLLATLRRRCASLDDAEDLAQESFTRAFSEISKLQESSAFRSWLFAIAFNLQRNLERPQRGHGWEEDVISTEDKATDPALRSQEISPEKAAFEKERQQALQRAVARLSEQKRQIYQLRHEKERKVRQIAALMGLKEGTVKAHLAQIREILKNELGDDLGDLDE